MKLLNVHRPSVSAWHVCKGMIRSLTKTLTSSSSAPLQVNFSKYARAANGTVQLAL